MLWLMGQVWLWMVAAALAGAIITGVLSTRWVPVRRWVEEQVELELTPVAVIPALDELIGDPESAAEASLVSPFPTLADGARPWEQEEAWSKPLATTQPARRRPADEWDDAAEHWREWAQAATTPSDTDTSSPGDHAAAGALTLEGDTYAEREPAFPTAAAQSFSAPAAFDDFPHAAPVEALRRPTALPESDPAEYARRAARRLEAERLERLEAERLERLEAERLEAERLEAERLEAERLEAERLEAERLEAERLEADERVAAERAEEQVLLEADRREQERYEAEVFERERAEQARVEAERREAERLAAARAEHERLAAEVRAQEEQRLAAERAEDERLAAEREERRRQALLRAEEERQAALRAEEERQAAARVEHERRIALARAQDEERLAAARAQAARLAAERAEEERKAALRAESERLAAALAEQERVAEAARRAEEERQAALQAEEEAREAVEREAAERRAPQIPQAPRHAVSLGQWSEPTPELVRMDLEPRVISNGPYGEGSAYPAPDGSAPHGFSIKGNEQSRVFHNPGSRYYSRAKTDVWFDSEEAAEAAGFVRWDRRATLAHEVLRASRPGSAQENPPHVA